MHPCTLPPFLYIGMRDIKALAVKCNNAEKGCDWEGTVGTIEEHVSKCGFTQVPCPKDCKDGDEVQHFMRKDLPSHLEGKCPNREHECNHCGEKDTYTNITQVHDEICHKKVIPCPNVDCADTIERQGIKRHLEDCIHENIPCKYQKLGCDVWMKRNVLSTHESRDKLHLHMALDKVINMQTDIATMEADIASAKAQISADIASIGAGIASTKKGATIKSAFKVKNFSAQSSTVFSPPFYTSPNGYHMDIMVYPRAGKGCAHVSVYVRILVGENDESLPWPFVGDIAITLLNQLADEHHFQRVLKVASSNAIRQNSVRGYREFIPHSGLFLTGNTHYLKDDTLYFRISVDVPHSKPWLE